MTVLPVPLYVVVVFVVVVVGAPFVGVKLARISVEVTTCRPLRWGETVTGVKIWLGMVGEEEKKDSERDEVKIL